MEKKILVLGATGTLGQPVTRALKDAGYQVRILARDAQKAHRLFDDTCEIMVGNPVEIECLGQALEGCYGVHISLPTEVEQQVAENVALAASKHGVKRISYISGRTVFKENCWFPMVNRKFLAEKAIREAGIPYTIFCPTWVMESLPMFVQQGRASVFGKQPFPYHWVAAQDIASLVIKAYSYEEAANKRLIVHGPEAILMQEALRRYCAVLQPEITKVSSMPFWLANLMAIITRNQGLKGASELMSYFEQVGEGRVLPNVNGVLGAPTTTLDVWLQKRKASIGDRFSS